MNIIIGIARGFSSCVRAPPSLAAEERMVWERSTYESECMKTCCLGAKNSVVKGLRDQLPEHSAMEDASVFVSGKHGK